MELYGNKATDNEEMEINAYKKLYLPKLEGLESGHDLLGLLSKIYSTEIFSKTIKI